MTLALYWPDVASFVHMGGYGGFVWGSLAVTLGALGFELAALRSQRQQALRQVQQATRQAARQAGRQR